MIFVTVGSQMPFDRMISIVDKWAENNLDEDVIAQVGNSTLEFNNITCVKNLSPTEYLNKIKTARIVVGHAGMGTILTCRDYGKPLLIMPRKGDLKETRNDHQIATLKWVKDWSFINVFNNVSELDFVLNNSESIFNHEVLPTYTNDLAESLKNIIFNI